LLAAIRSGKKLKKSKKKPAPEAKSGGGKKKGGRGGGRPMSLQDQMRAALSKRGGKGRR